MKLSAIGKRNFGSSHGVVGSVSFLCVLTQAAELNTRLGFQLLTFAHDRLDPLVRAGEVKMPSKEQESDLHKLRFVQQVGATLLAHGSACFCVVGRPLT